VLVCVDVHYGVAATTAALVGFRAWSDPVPALELVDDHPPDPAPYHPGSFFERELPYLVAIVARVTEPIEAIIVDGYVWLGPERPGLGVHVHERFGVPVIGVAKTTFAGASATPVVRGTSARPLLVTSIGIDPGVAAAHIGAMHGPFRIPTLLKRVDSLARGHVVPGSARAIDLA
jgi:deoxyribonuclease V